MVLLEEGREMGQGEQEVREEEQGVGREERGEERSFLERWSCLGKRNQDAVFLTRIRFVQEREERVVFPSSGTRLQTKAGDNQAVLEERPQLGEWGVLGFL